MAKEMKPCPFCGSDDLVPSFHTGKHERLVCVSCAECDAEGPTVVIHDSDNDRSAALTKAHEAWDKRK